MTCKDNHLNGKRKGQCFFDVLLFVKMFREFDKFLIMF